MHISKNFAKIYKKKKLFSFLKINIIKKFILTEDATQYSGINQEDDKDSAE